MNVPIAAPIGGAIASHSSSSTGPQLMRPVLSQRQGDHVHPVSEIVRQHGQADHQSHLDVRTEREADRQAIQGAVDDQADRADQRER